MDKQRGFSLPETLVAALLFAMSFSALTHYQLALAQGYQRQFQQREAWRLAWQRFEGYQAAGWHSTLSTQNGTEGCPLLTAHVLSPAGRKASLSLLRCPDGTRPPVR